MPTPYNPQPGTKTLINAVTALHSSTLSSTVTMATALTADQLSHQLDSLKLDLQTRNVKELVSAEKVCKEFLNLNLPVQSEVDIWGLTCLQHII